MRCRRDIKAREGNVGEEGMRGREGERERGREGGREGGITWAQGAANPSGC